jgi:hypothetical protein
MARLQQNKHAIKVHKSKTASAWNIKSSSYKNSGRQHVSMSGVKKVLAMVT